MRHVAALVGLAAAILLTWMLLPSPSTSSGLALAIGLCALVAFVIGMIAAGRAALLLFYAGRLTLIVAGYLGAVLSASAFIWFVGAAAVGSDAAPGELPAMLAGLVLFAGVAIAFIIPAVALCATPPAAATILISELFGARGWLFYALAGGAIGLVATELFARWMLSPTAASPGLGFRATMSGGGIVGGVAYWLVAGRLAGRWRARSWAKLGGALG